MDTILNQDDSSENIAIAATAPKNPEPILAAMASLSINEDSFNCISDSGEKISIKKSIIEKIPYFKIFFRSELDNDNENDINFKPPAKNENGDYILPPEIELAYLKPILAYVESGRPLYLFTKLSTQKSIHDLIALYDFLMIEKPNVTDLETIRKRTTEDIKDYNEKIARKVYEFHSASYGRADARAAAGEFCVGLAMGLYDLSSNSNRQKIFSRTEFILSHSRTFRRRLRHHAKAIADARLTWLTWKQRQILEKWATRFSADLPDGSDEGSNTDRSISSEHYDCYSSDCYDSDFD